MSPTCWIKTSCWVFGPRLSSSACGRRNNAASVSYLSLVTDLADEDGRSRAVSIMWTAMILSTIITSLGLSRMLATPTPPLGAAAIGDLSKETLFAAFGVIWFVSVIFVLVGSYRIEPRASARTSQPAHRADDPMQVLRLLAQNPEARKFFVYLMIVLISIHAQDVLLEPFGAKLWACPSLPLAPDIDLGSGHPYHPFGRDHLCQALGQKDRRQWSAPT